MANDVYWRDTARHPRFFLVDARVAYAFLLVLFHIRIWTILTALSVMIFLWVVEMFGLSPPVALRTFYIYIATLGYRWRHIGNHRYMNRRTL